MKIALIQSVFDQSVGLGVAHGQRAVIDVAMAVEVARRHSASQLLPQARTIKGLLKAGDDAITALNTLIDFVDGLDRDEAISEGAIREEASVAFHPPIPDPEKFLCVGKNYRAHLDELVRTDLIREIPEEPTAFVKLNSVIAAHGDAIVRPKGIREFDYEPELAFVIGRGGRGVGKGDAYKHVFGITLFNDLTAREIQRREVKSGTRFWTAKNMPGFGPIGPYIVTMDEAGDVNNLDIECHVNGEHRMRFNTSDQIFKIPDIIAHFSEYVPMAPGDLFATGSAAGVAVGQPNAEELFLRPGDEVEVILGDVMTLKNTIVEDPTIDQTAR